MSKKFCPVCKIKRFLDSRKLHVVATKTYDNGVALTPPMGWSSWNTFRQNIDEKIIRETAQAMKDTGLIEAGYQYLNLDDCWQSSLRDEQGRLQGDLTNFPSGMKKLVEDVNALGMKLGLYTSNGTLTCEDLPASLGHEETDARTLAEWGVEYFKYDFCHNETLPYLAPYIDKILIGKAGDCDSIVLQAEDAKLSGNAVIVKDKAMDSGKYVKGLCAGGGSVTFDNIEISEGGEYILTIGLRKHVEKEKFLQIIINGDNIYNVIVPATKSWSPTGRLQVRVTLKAGRNTIFMHNPVVSKYDSAAEQYKNMGRELKRATREYAEKNNVPEKPICYSICEWGWNKPYKWGREAGNLWRTTPDITATWTSILGIYEITVKLNKYAGVGGWNDPDMLEVGNGKLTEDENRAHFTLWCMMASPLILGNDIRAFYKADGTVDKDNKTLKILTNKEAIAIDQDKLGVPGWRYKMQKNLVDIIVKPLENAELAVCFLNKNVMPCKAEVDLRALANSADISLPQSDKYTVHEIWSGETAETTNILSADSIPSHGVKLYRIKAI